MLTHSRTDRHTTRRTYSQTDTQPADRHPDGHTIRRTHSQIDTQLDGHTARQTRSQTDTHPDRHPARQIHNQTDTHPDRHTTRQTSLSDCFWRSFETDTTPETQFRIQKYELFGVCVTSSMSRHHFSDRFWTSFLRIPLLKLIFRIPKSVCHVIQNLTQ